MVVWFRVCGMPWANDWDLVLLMSFLRIVGMMLVLMELCPILVNGYEI